MTSSDRTVIHLQYDGLHYYYGSLASLFDHFTPQQLGIGYGSLRNYGLSETKPYQNSKCIIRKGTLISKPGGRGRKPSSVENK